MQSKPADTKETSKSKSEKPDKPARRKPFIFIIILIVAGLLAYFLFFNKQNDKHPGFLRVSGRIEGYETNVGAKIAGRVESIANREGEEVQLGQPLVRLSDEDIQAQLRGANAKYDQSIQSAHEAEAQLQVAREQVNQSILNVRQAKEDAKGRIDQAYRR